MDELGREFLTTLGGVRNAILLWAIHGIVMRRSDGDVIGQIVYRVAVEVSDVATCNQSLFAVFLISDKAMDLDRDLLGIDSEIKRQVSIIKSGSPWLSFWRHNVAVGHPITL